VTLKNYLVRREKFELPLIASLQDDSRHPREFIQHFRDEHKRGPANACLWIGPEGDFSPVEMNIIKAEGARSITLGRLVLRSDTAAIYGLSVLNYELQ
jgi:16S rRNA (uracil1498-N3)-methyltransferase